MRKHFFFFFFFFFFQNKTVERMNEEINCIKNEGQTAKNEWKNDNSKFL